MFAKFFTVLALLASVESRGSFSLSSMQGRMARSIIDFNLKSARRKSKPVRVLDDVLAVEYPKCRNLGWLTAAQKEACPELVQ